MKILLAVDGSAHTRKMLTYVVSNELLFRPGFTFVVLYISGRDDVDQALREGRPVIDDAAGFLHAHLGIVPQRAVRLGRAADAIADYAHDNQCNLVVMGSHGHAGLKALVLGSVTQGVLALSRVPVLVVR